ncbi:hypothetical protein ACJMK2_039967 [Sinanodonta woodiana]|uniref:Uncharacterized protein n=1 Tax=Sinanodonta woodiana TaxID=1069815 RepID=A0ABD3WEI2_SINWO
MADRELYYFLNGRGGDTTKLEKEKVDESVIALMTDKDLKEYVPKYGDRIVVLAFARRIVSSESKKRGSSSEDRKRNPLMRLKDRLDQRNSHGRYLSLIGNRNAKKVQSRLEVGWLDFDPVTESYNRQLKLNVHITMAELLAKILLFPNGESMRGKLDEFTFDISDFSKCSISQEQTLEEVYHETKMKLLCVYMATTRRCASTFPPIRKHQKFKETYTWGQILELGRESSMEQVSNDSSFDNALILRPEKIPLSQDMPTYCQSPDDSSEVMFSYLIPTSEMSALNETIGRCVKVIQLHRGHILKEYIDCILENSSLDLRGTNIKVEMILPNGQKRLRKTVVIFDVMHYQNFGIHSMKHAQLAIQFQVPAISHIMTDKTWKACARIIIIVYKQERYFPIQLALPFFFIHASTDFESVNFDNILEACESHDVRHRPTQHNISKILKQMAHKELIQAPAFVAECWHDIFCLDLQPLLPKDLTMQILDVPDDLSNAERETVQYLKKYIKGLSEDMLRNFLRFVTGKDANFGEFRREINGILESHICKTVFQYIFKVVVFTCIKYINMLHNCMQLVKMHFLYADDTNKFEFKCFFHFELSLVANSMKNR